MTPRDPVISGGWCSILGPEVPRSPPSRSSLRAPLAKGGQAAWAPLPAALATDRVWRGLRPSDQRLAMQPGACQALLSPTGTGARPALGSGAGAAPGGPLSGISPSAPGQAAPRPTTPGGTGHREGQPHLRSSSRTEPEASRAQDSKPGPLTLTPHEGLGAVDKRA